MAQIVLNPPEAIIEAIRELKQEDTEEYRHDVIKLKHYYHSKWEMEIFDNFITLKHDFQNNTGIHF
jgi:hypothetical protein